MTAGWGVEWGWEEPLDVPFRGQVLLEQPLYNKGTAFTRQERRELGLLGLLPPIEETLEEQTIRAYEAYGAKPTDLERHIYLRQLQDLNETLFHRLLLDHLAEMAPIVYTPTVGLACERFSHIFRRPRGLFIAYPEREHIDEILANAPCDGVRVIVVTDGERILGLGDQGAGGMGIPIGKLSLYSACGGVDPAVTLPILLDVGTNNRERLADPLYIGWRHERIAGAEYDAFVDQFVAVVIRRFPGVLLQWEDFAQAHAGVLLERYRDRLCSFNDDIQGTAAVVTGTLLAATGGKLSDQRIAILGAGSAGCGIAEELVSAMRSEGLDEREARERIFMVDRDGLLHSELPSLPSFQRRLAQPRERVAAWRPGTSGRLELLEVVENASPTILIGTSGQPGLFTEAVVKAMAARVERPIILPLSNPTTRAEATPGDILRWTDGRAMVATGSPFGDVEHAGQRYVISQCNNSYIFPGLGLGVLASGARRVSDGMFMAAARALAACSPAGREPGGAILPPLDQARPVARAIAIAVGLQAGREGLAEERDPAAMERFVDAQTWVPRYRLIRFQHR